MNAPVFNVRTSGVFEGTSGGLRRGNRGGDTGRRAPALGEGDRSGPVHRLPRLHDRVQERERGPARRHPHLRQVGRGRRLSPGPPGVPGNQVQSVRGRALRGRLPDPGHVPAPRRDRGLRQADLRRLQGLHRGLPLRRDLHQPGGQLGREMQPVRAPAGDRARAGLRYGLPDRGHPGRRPERPGLEGGPDREPRAGHGAQAGEGHPAGPVLQGRAPGHARPARGPPARRRPVRLGHPGRRARSRSRHRRAPWPGRLQCRGAAVLRRGPSRTMGLAGQPLHLDQGRGRGRPAGPADPDPGRGCPGTTRWPAGRRPRWRWPSSA